jgi:hypothetical protein
MGNPFEQLELENDPAVNPSAVDYNPPNPFAVLEEQQKPQLNQYNAFSPGRAGDAVARATGEPFNRGVIGLLEFPITLTNAAIAGGYTLAGAESAPQMRYPISEMAQASGITAPEGERSEGLIPRMFEFTGAGAIPSAAIMNLGRLALSELSAVPTALKQLGMATAKSPGVATAYDMAANFTAASGGQLARQYTDNETVIAMAELGSGFLPTAAIFAAKTLPTGQMTNKAHDWILETLAPFTEAGGRVAASKRLQDVAADPKALAASLDVDSPVPPMQQSGDPGILKLQDIILKQSPRLRQEWSEALELAITQLSRETEFPGGDVERASHLLNVRQQMAVENAAEAVARLGQDATPRQISLAAKKAAQAALDDAVNLEKALWESLDTTAPADIENAAATMSEILAKRSPDADPSDIPQWLINKMSASPLDPALLAGLEKKGLVSPDGYIDPAIQSALERQGLLKTRQRNLGDVQTLRSRVLHEIRVEKAALAPNRNKLRILNDIQSSLLDDMTATGVSGVDDARAFSSAVNERFRQGRVGKLLGFDVTGAEKVAPEDFLQSIVYGEASATNMQRFGEMANSAPELTLSFIKARYLESVLNESGSISQSAHNTFIKSMKKKGVFEIFPELESELSVAAKTGAEALKLEVPNSHINTTRLNKNQSRAALLLQANPGEEMTLVLKSKDPSGAIKDLMKTRTPDGKILANDRAAVLGLQDSFVEEILTMSSREVNGIMVPQGKNLKVLLDKYKHTMRALHIGDSEVHRLNTIAENIRLAQMGVDASVDIGSSLLDTGLKTPIEFLARILGARAGGRIGQDAGSQLVIAGFMSKQTRNRLARITASEAEKLIVRAVSDGELYRSLLVSPTASNATKVRAAKILEREILRLESAGRTTLAIGAAQEENE